ncbi:hypothetical protein EUX98_g3124 [Antrodiella citrinella]|uniref:Survival protein SurE-like phosphatase/nucleotidase domain-containing protein n=1 Tax=Antrodiella citrinella TaxID=2447956 RepID=A0A4S4N050_9APHY|nr:hypothetical protein EUX98_g3124 [Antrodiella citrinella]
MLFNFVSLALLADGLLHKPVLSTTLSSLQDSTIKVVLSAPAVDHSGQGAKNQTPTVLQTPCQFNTCPKGSPAEGSDPTPRLNYVNGFGPDAMKFGIQTLSPEFLGGPPDIAISGPSVGGSASLHAFIYVHYQQHFPNCCHGGRARYPRGHVLRRPSFHLLRLVHHARYEPQLHRHQSILLYVDLVTKFTGALWNSGAPFLDPDVVLAVNFPAIAGSATVDDVTFVMAKMATHNITTIEICGREQLPLVDEVMMTKGCFASVTALNGRAFNDLSAEHEQRVFDRIGTLIGCL